jgi:hypothetical protein
MSWMRTTPGVGVAVGEGVGVVVAVGVGETVGVGVAPEQGCGEVALFRGFGLRLWKSVELLSVSVQPPPPRTSAVVVLGGGRVRSLAAIGGRPVTDKVDDSG